MLQERDVEIGLGRPEVFVANVLHYADDFERLCGTALWPE